jgi:secreted PhoX family phosphatase
LGKTLFVLSKEGKLKHIEKLEKEILPQPEGITFDADGTLYIASEGRDGAARLCIFKLK